MVHSLHPLKVSEQVGNKSLLQHHPSPIAITKEDVIISLQRPGRRDHLEDQPMAAKALELQGSQSRKHKLSIALFIIVNGQL